MSTYINRIIENLTTEYYRNPRLAQLVILFVILYIWFNTWKYSKNVKIAVKNRPAKPGEYSHQSDYTEIYPMKHDMFKQMTVDLLPIIIVFGGPSLIYYLMHHDDPDFLPIIKFEDLISFASYKEFLTSVFGRSILSVMGIFIYYQFVEPVVVNRIPSF
jgi:hypothetical protein